MTGDVERLTKVRSRVQGLTGKLGRRIKMLVGKPGLDGHSNGAEQIALRARDAGFEVVYEGIRLTPEQIVDAALEEGVHVVGLSILSGSHVPLVTEIMERMRAAELEDVPVIVGGIIPPEDADALVAAGVSRVYTPKDFDLNAIMGEIIDIVEAKEAA
jgi:(2R)-ethylmalonyl-CoA mutase